MEPRASVLGPCYDWLESVAITATTSGSRPTQRTMTKSVTISTEIIIVVCIALGLYYIGRYFARRKTVELPVLPTASTQFPVLPASPAVMSPSYYTSGPSTPHLVESPPVYTPTYQSYPPPSPVDLSTVRGKI